MKKTSILLFVGLCSATLAQAQVREPADARNDRMEFQAYTIHLMPAVAGTYSYYIVKGNQMVLHQSRNPFTGSSAGLTKKEDIYKVAQWQIQNVKSGPVLQIPTHPQKQIPGFAKLPTALQQRFQRKTLEQQPQLLARVPLKVAEELHINPNH
jgi:hypothetical protein